MISIVICSKSNNLFQKVSESIKETIGVPYEIICIENWKGQIGICEAYNKGAAKAKYAYLCFSHEDVIFHTRNWGTKLIEHLSVPGIGVVGVCGCTIKTKSPSGVSIFYNEANRTWMLQTGNDGKPFEKYWNPLNEERSEVKVLDGLFLCCRKEVWKENKFDEYIFPNFHGYDIDFSLQVSQKYKNYVVYDIIVEHSSEGHNNKAWISSVLRLSEKWKNMLPVYTQSLGNKELNSIEFMNRHYFLREAIKTKTSLRVMLPQYLKGIAQKPFAIENIKLIKAYLFN